MKTRSTHRGFTLWLTGLSGSGKSTLSGKLAHILRERGEKVELLDGDEVRTHLSKGLTFSKEDRDINVQRIGYVARLLARNGVITLTAAISPYRDIRDQIRSEHEADGVPFVEIYTEASLDALSERDVKGLYKKALAGEIPHFTGVSDPYEPPLHPEISVRTDRETVEDSLAKILSALTRSGLLENE